MLLSSVGRLLAIGTLLLSFAPHAATAIQTRRLETGRFSGVLLDAGSVVWLDENRATPRLRLFDGITRTLEDQGATRDVQLDGGSVVWLRDLGGGRELRLFDGSSSRTLDQVSGIDQSFLEIALDDGVVFWRSRDRQDEILHYFGGNLTLVLDRVEGNQHFGSVFFDDGVVVWETVNGVQRTLKRFDGTTTSVLDSADGRRTFGRIVFSDGMVLWEHIDGIQQELLYAGPAGVLRLAEASSFGTSLRDIALDGGFAVWEKVQPNRVDLEGFKGGGFASLDRFEGLLDERGMLLVEGGAALWEKIGPSGRELRYSAGGAGATLDAIAPFVGGSFGQVVLRDGRPAWERVRSTETILKTFSGFVVDLDDEAPFSDLQVDQSSVAWVRNRDPLLLLFDGAIWRALDDRAPFSDVQLAEATLVWQNGRGELRFFDGAAVSKLDDDFRASDVQTDEGSVVWVRSQGGSRELFLAPEPGSAGLALASLAAVWLLARRARVPERRASRRAPRG